MRFAGRRALVTGSGSGIGLAISRALVAEGADVTGIDRADQAAIAAELGDAFAPVVADVTDEAQLAVAIADAAPIDLAVNAAGASRGAPIAEMSRETWDFTLELVLTGVFLSVKHEAGALVDGGAIVNVGSINGRIPMYAGAAYVAAKAGVEAFTRNAAIELAPRGIRVNSVLPGLVVTPLTAGFRGVPAIAQALDARIPLHRAGEAHEIAQPVLFLLSDAASYVTGTSLVVDGGWEIAGYPDLTGLIPDAP